MRKIPSEYENPFDDTLLNICEDVAPTFHSYGFTPNMITTLSNISAILVVILLLKANYIWASVLFIISYFFDCLDGHIARKYNQVSVFGDYYDHISDWIKLILILFTMYWINSEKFMEILPFIIIANILMCIHLGYQEKYHDKPDSYMLEQTKLFAPGDPNDKKMIGRIMEYTKYVGSGTFNLVIALSILYYNY